MSDIKPGDIVKFLDEVGGGRVTKIIDANTALIETEDGFEFPYPLNKLIVVRTEKDYSETTENQEEQHQGASLLDDSQPDIIKDNEETNIYLGVVPQNPFQLAQTGYELHLVNDSNWHLLYVYQIPYENQVKSTPGHLQPNMMEQLMTLDAQSLGDLREISFHILFFRRTPHQSRKPLIAKIRLKPEKLFDTGSYIDNDYFETKALLYPILEEHPLDEALKKLRQHDFHQVKREKEDKNRRLNQPRQFRSGKKPELWEIDLHITELLDDTRGMSAKDMLDYQMQVFKDKLDEGLRDPNVKKIVFIHGRGNGRLRQEIRAFLDRKNIPYQDASFAKYGFGATMVFVDRKK